MFCYSFFFFGGGGEGGRVWGNIPLFVQLMIKTSASEAQGRAKKTSITPVTFYKEIGENERK